MKVSMVHTRRDNFSPRELPVLNGRAQPSASSTTQHNTPRKFENFKVGLVHPYLKEAQKKNRLKFRESLALGYLTAALEANDFDVVTVNAELRSLGPEEVGELLLGDPCIGLVGISAKSQRTYSAAKQIARFIKRERPEIHITIGGVFPTAADMQVMDDCADFDSIVRGEGEDAIVELATSIAGGIALDDMLGLTFRNGNGVTRTANRPRIANLDDLHFPARRDLEYILSNGTEALASAYLVASRGCYAACTFCSIHQIYGDHLVKRRSPESIVDEMEHLINHFGVSRFSFVDDLFITPSPNGILWVHDFCKVIEERGLDVNFYAEMRADTVDKKLVDKLRKAGLHRLFIGMEAGTDSVLKRWDKGTTVAENDRALAILREIAMPPHAVNFGYIMFDPEMTFEELNQQYQWLRGSGYCTVQHLQNKMNIYWGTPHYTRMLEQGRVDTSSFGQRWIYEFDDPRVGAVEAAFRRFHLRFQEECIEEYLDANESFRLALKVHHDRTNKELSPMLIDLVSQAQRRCEQAHRDAYYFVFDALLSFAAQSDGVPPEVEERIWHELAPLIEQLNRDSRHLLAFTREITQLQMLGDGESPAPGTAWQEDGGRIGCVWLKGQGGDMGYRAVVGASGHDRYDHSCELVAYGSPLKTPIKTLTLREVLQDGRAALVEMEIPL
jgi:radical SAM superfamily enzyme YgiQ (UPF0313 family)